MLTNIGNLHRDTAPGRILLFPFVLTDNVLMAIFRSFVAPPDQENPFMRTYKTDSESAKTDPAPQKSKTHGESAKRNPATDNPKA